MRKREVLYVQRNIVAHSYLYSSKMAQLINALKRAKIQMCHSVKLDIHYLSCWALFVTECA